MRVAVAIFINRAPFEDLRISIPGDEKISILSGINGTGKTTIISYIVDAFHELAKKGYHQQFEDKENAFYRVSSGLFSLDVKKPSIVYFRFKKDDDSNLDYIDIRGECTEEVYNNLIDIVDKIPYKEIQRNFQNKVLKLWSSVNSNDVQNIFSTNILTYFPAYRYETPAFLNNIYRMEPSFNMKMIFTGYLSNPIEVTSELPQIANWIMDVVLDYELYKGDAVILLEQLNNVLTNILESKLKCKTRLGIGPRTSGLSRIAVMERDLKGGQVYPSVFNMSSGELALLCLFGELIKQADKINRINTNVSGIVLVDEIDKHLHVQLQKEILPRLIAMFPRLQFLVSSHSPFLGIGLDEYKEISYSIYDLDNGGVVCPLQNNDLFLEVYNQMVVQNNQYYTRYKKLQEKIKNDTKPIIITEGKTDWKHLNAAMKHLDISDLDIELYEYDDIVGDSNLKQLLNNYSFMKQSRAIIGLFDRDDIKKLGIEQLLTSEYVALGNNVFAFAIPLANTDEYGENISIEHYYKRDDLTKPDANGRRIFLGDEFYSTGFSKDSKLHTRCKGIDKKSKTCGVVDDKVFMVSSDPEEKHSIALSKNDFAELVLNGEDYAESFDFTAFQRIFDIIRKILVELKRKS